MGEKDWHYSVLQSSRKGTGEELLGGRRASSLSGLFYRRERLEPGKDRRLYRWEADLSAKTVVFSRRKKKIIT